MKIIVVGSGKLAGALLASDWSFLPHDIVRWETSIQSMNEKAIVIHTGSGRQMEECTSFCSRTQSAFIQLSTGLEPERKVFDFPYISCPNASILILKALQMINETGKYFEHFKISILESHQLAKKTEAGTALAFARSLNVPANSIISVRNPDIQQNIIGIPEAYLSKHAYHKIQISDGDDELIIEMKVLGHASYVNGVKTIVRSILENNLENKQYSIFELPAFNAAV